LASFAYDDGAGGFDAYDDSSMNGRSLSDALQITVQPEMPELYDAEHDEDQDLMLQQESRALPTGNLTPNYPKVQKIGVSSVVNGFPILCEICRSPFGSINQLQR